MFRRTFVFHQIFIRCICYISNEHQYNHSMKFSAFTIGRVVLEPSLFDMGWLVANNHIIIIT
jgi:hypothetical protein